MELLVEIGRDALGENTDDDNQRFVKAVEKKLTTEYPGAIVDVSLKENSLIAVKSNCDEEKIIDRVSDLQEHIWSKADY